MSGIRTIVLTCGKRFYIAFETDKKPCKHCRKIIIWGYQENGRMASVEEFEGKFRLHFPHCEQLLEKRYGDPGYKPRTDGVGTDDSVLPSIKEIRREFRWKPK